MEGHNSVKSLQLQYFSAVESTDIRALQDVLKHKSRFDVNAVNTNGKTALQLAVRRISTDVIRVLLHHNVNIGDALLHAIEEKFIKAIELILNHPQGQDLIDAHAGSSSEEFHPDTTPLILAAHHNDHDIIKLLIKNGATPIAVSSYQTENHTIQRSIGKLNVYKALASEAYMCVIETATETKPDPFRRAFELCQELRKESSKEYEFREEYLELAAKCGQFSADLLGQTRDSAELKAVLSHDSLMSKRGIGKEGRPMKVLYAVQRQHKKFVVHPHCQQHLSELWYRGLENWQDSSLTWNLVISTLIMLAFPVLGLLYLIYPYGKFGRFMRIPYIKFLMHTASYICFLVFLFLTTTHLNNTYDIHHESKIVELEFEQRLSQQRGSLPTKVEILIALWIIGMTWREICEMRNSGLSDYLAHAWNILDLMQIGLYWVWLGLRTASIIIVEREGTAFEYLDYSNEDSGVYPTSSNEATLWNVTDARDHFLPPALGATPPNSISLANTTMHLNMDEQLKRILEAIAADVADKIMTSTIYQEAIANISLQLNQLSQAVSDLSDEERSFNYGYFGSDFKFPEILDQPEFSMQRKDWKQYDPTLLADLIMAIVNVISVIRFLRVVVINKYVGPLQISVGKMLTDIMKFMFIFGLVWVAFALGLTQVYWGYAPDRMLECIQVDQESYKECYEKRFFADVWASLKTLFWSLYGLIDLEALQVEADHLSTEFVGALLFACYQIAAVIILLNLLIALMGTTYDSIVENTDIEWKFHRADLWMDYFSRGITKAPPFNIFPSSRSFINFFRRLHRCLCCRKDAEVRKKVHQKSECVKESQKNYEVICRRLIARYLADKPAQHTDNSDGSYPLRGDSLIARFELCDMIQRLEKSIDQLRDELRDKPHGNDDSRRQDDGSPGDEGQSTTPTPAGVV